MVEDTFTIHEASAFARGCRQLIELRLRGWLQVVLDWQHLVDELRDAARLLRGRMRNLARPSVILGAQLSPYGCAVTGATLWQASYGGLIVSGDTPEDAFHAFDRAWNYGVE